MDIPKGKAVWKDEDGIMHWAVGDIDTVHQGIRLLWTHCGKRDIPANKAWYKNPEDKVDCSECLSE